MKRKLATIGFLFIELCIIFFSFFFVAWFKAKTKIYIEHYFRPVLGFGVIWFGIGLWGQKFSLKKEHNARSYALNIIKSDVVALAVIFGAIYLFQFFHYSRLIVFGTIALTTFLELLFFLSLYYALQFHKENASFASSSLMTRSKELEEAFSDRFFRDASKVVPIIEDIPYKPEFPQQAKEPLLIPLWQSYLQDYQELFSFLNDKLDLLRFDKEKTLITNCEDITNITTIIPESIHFLLNLYRLNDLRRINFYLIKVNKILCNGAVAVCCAETRAQRKNKCFKKYTPYLGFFIYLFDFIFHRVFPKLPVIQGFYFFVTKGKDRALAESEIIGRFYFCGFELIAKRIIDDKMYFILKKVKEPSNNPNPSYGPLIRLKRIGQNRKIIYINKFRTMHPYAEYLQEYVYKTSKLQEGGKFANDFRITSWGKLLRKLWLDELPQLLNLFKGDVSLVGVRALSEHYFNLYPSDLQELRCKFKPGLVPPFYADMPKTFEEILDSERKYLQKKIQNPFFTDWVYFWKAFWNIVFKHARSN